MTSTTLRGLGIALFFGIVIWVLIPGYVPKPAFLPGFALPPDFWPRVISIAGLVFGLIAAGLGLAGQGTPALPAEVAEDDTPMGTLLARLGLLVAAFVAFVLLVDVIGFLAAAILLTGAGILLTGERRLLAWGAGLALILPVCLYLFFTEALGTQFPPGLLFN
ncbi:hypothetical protein OCH239_06990 [Roseivivax halodurans JCM 10272]|uniref:DUF1468 domain-containing protein n=1 Tax=Roseivivax halodurans JCM 10272 TaxID=1449350 RepID=X7ED57_9RHOB|nr:tripartite tricarboxylate transporter TctB family protein [Roseivivax halodurans]ETX13810.1 hypothetical protein OCH239_06990 [Roseivivax halodurans JCM 10272]